MRWRGGGGARGRRGARRGGGDGGGVRGGGVAGGTQGLREQVRGRFWTMSDAIITKIDEMQEKIEALERSVEEIASETREGK